MLSRNRVIRLIGEKFSHKPSLQTENIQELENYWKKATDWYNIYNTRLSLKAYKTIVPFLQLSKAKKILEIGGGTGAGAEIILPKLSQSATYTLTDHIDCFIQAAKSKNLPNTEVIKVVPSNLPFSGESFDRFIALATIEELETTKKILNEAYRVLQPEGIIAASVSGKRESDNYRVISDRVKQKFGIQSPLKFRSDLKNAKIVKKMFYDSGFSKTFAFYENIYFESNSIKELKAFFMQEPSIAEQPRDKLEKIDHYLEEQLINLIKIEEVPLGMDFLIIIGYKE